MGPTRRLNEAETATRNQRKDALEKDASEIQLEKILFGDQIDFFNSLNAAAVDEQKSLQRLENGQDGYGSASAEDEESDEDLKDVPDEDLFFLDAGQSNLPEDVMQDLRIEKVEPHKDDNSRKALWHDSDDERLTVSLVSNRRLRKLRDTEDDDIVNGLEYIKRLRRQYERLHPPPEWVKYARKKRKISHNEQEDFDADSDVSLDNSASTAVKPLAELLRSTASLTRADGRSSDMPTHSLKLRPEIIDIQRLKDVASTGPSSIDTIQFHPTYPLLLTSGPSSTINLYHVSPSSQRPNPLVTSLHVKGTPITSAAFAVSSDSHRDVSTSKDKDQPLETRIYFSARRRYFHTWSLNDGALTKISRPLYSNPTTNSSSVMKKSRKNHEMPTTEHLLTSPNSELIALVASTGSSGGVVHLLSSTTHQPVCQCRIDGLNGIADVAFWRDSNGISVVGKNGEVSEFNLTERRIMARWIDEGAVGTTTLALGGEINFSSNPEVQSFGSDRYVAIGSTSGIVNIYDRRPILAHFRSASTDSTGSSMKISSLNSGALFRPKPLRSLDQLTTPISHLKFSSHAAGQLLVMASRWKKNALRLVHLPSATVYKNWPTDRTPLGRISCVAISFDERYLVVGNEAGKVRLWQIRD